MYLKQEIMLTLGLLLLSNTLQADELAIKRFQTALGACERALQMEMPKSRGSLKILQSLQKRYQRNKEFALKIEESLKESVKHQYSGEFFVDETFKQAFQTCESELATKVNEAEKVVSEKIAEREDKQQKQETIVETLIKKIETAEQQVKIAVVDNCVVYMQTIMQADNGKPTLSKTKIASLQRGYQKAKQKALETYPDIIKQFYTASVTDPFTAEKKEESRVVANWFSYCEETFAEQVSEETAQALVGPKLPNLDKKLSTPAPVLEEVTEEEIPKSAVKKEQETVVKEKATATTEKAVKEAEPPVDKKELETVKEKTSSPISKEEEEDASPAISKEEEKETSPPTPDEEEDASPPAFDEEDDSFDYQKVLSTMREDRAKILKENERLPDYVNNDEDDFQAATVWQYEDNDKCTIYQFRDDKLVRTKVVPGECPEF